MPSTSSPGNQLASHNQTVFRVVTSMCLWPKQIIWLFTPPSHFVLVSHSRVALMVELPDKDRKRRCTASDIDRKHLTPDGWNAFVRTTRQPPLTLSMTPPLLLPPRSQSSSLPLNHPQPTSQSQVIPLTQPLVSVATTQFWREQKPGASVITSQWHVGTTSSGWKRRLPHASTALNVSITGLELNESVSSLFCCYYSLLKIDLQAFERCSVIKNMLQFCRGNNVLPWDEGSVPFHPTSESFRQIITTVADTSFSSNFRIAKNR